MYFEKTGELVAKIAVYHEFLVIPSLIDKQRIAGGSLFRKEKDRFVNSLKFVNQLFLGMVDIIVSS